MAEKNIQMTQRNNANTGWDNLYPITTAENVQGAYGTATGTNTLVLSLTPAPSKLLAGMTIRFKNTTANTGGVTLNINSLGAKALLKNGDSALVAGNLKSGGVYTVCYDGTNFHLQGEGGGGNLQPNQALVGFTFTNDEGDQVGVGDADLIPANIKKDVDVFGVVGVLEGISAGETIVFTLSAQDIAGTSTNKVWKSVRIDKMCTVRFYYSLTMPNAQLGYVQVYKNGIPYGARRSTSSASSMTWAEDIQCVAGDVLALFIQSGTGNTVTMRFGDCYLKINLPITQV